MMKDERRQHAPQAAVAPRSGRPPSRPSPGSRITVSGKRRIVLPTAARTALCLVLAATTLGAPTSPDPLTDRFVQHVRQAGAYDAAARAFIAEQWEQRRAQDDADAFLLEALAVLSEDFRAALAAFQEERYADCAALMAPLADGDDPYLAVNAAVYEIKALIAREALEEAGQGITELRARGDGVERHTHAASELAYLQGYCELGNLDYRAALRSLGAFLERYPDAPQRLRVTARQMITEIERRVPGRIGEVTDLLDYAGRRLGNADSGDRVQQRQQEALDLLDRLIEEAEEQERNARSGGSGGGGSDSPQNRPQPSGDPLPDSRLAPGRPPPAGADADRRRRVARPGEAWGAMQPAERERILQTLKDRFPDRYRQLVEQYYRQLAEEP